MFFNGEGMAGRSLEFYQVFYKEEQAKELYNFATPYFNRTLTPFFENAIIAELVPQSKADLVSVCSWRLKQKRVDRSMQLRGQVELTEEKIINSDFDVAVLTPVSKSHKALKMAEHWHGKPWIDAIQKLKEYIRVPEELTYPIYENHFIATRKIYQDYVTQCLLPIITFMYGNEVFFARSGYAKRKTTAEREIIKDSLNMDDYPIAPFILERLFSIWIDDKNLNVVKI